MPAYREAFRNWVGCGVDALERGGRDGLRDWILADLAGWLRALRRRGGRDRARMFINMFSYECKVAFYSCYANAWLGLVPRLMAEGHLDTIGQRFHRLWHHQNQPTEDPTAPTGGHRDALCGQVLALHPLSGVALIEPDHLQAIGGWVGHPDYEEFVGRGRDGDSAAYWDMVAALLIAVHEYHRSRVRWDDGRGVKHVRGDSLPLQPSRDRADPTAGVIFDEAAGMVFVDASPASSPYERHDAPDEAAGGVAVHFRCRGAGHEEVVVIGEEALRDFLMAE